MRNRWLILLPMILASPACEPTAHDVTPEQAVAMGADSRVGSVDLTAPGAPVLEPPLAFEIVDARIQGRWIEIDVNFADDRRLIRFGRDPVTRTWTQTIQALQGPVLFGASITPDGTDDGFTVEEFTPGDRLVITHTVVDGILSERYDWNGRSRTWLRPDEGEWSEEQARGFRQFLPDDVSLNHNPEGDRLFTVLTDPTLPDLMTLMGGDRGGDYMDQEEMEIICDWHAVCSGIKCWFGGWANPICHYCTGVSVVCLAADIYCHYFPC